METKANYVLIGFFTLVVLAGGFGFVHWFRSSTVTGTRATYHVVFQGSVGGLRKGSTVEFNGMRVGEVADLQLDKRDPKQVLATISVDSNVPIRNDTYVRLEFAGLTGVASVELKGGDPAGRAGAGRPRRHSDHDRRPERDPGLVGSSPRAHQQARPAGWGRFSLAPFA